MSRGFDGKACVMTGAGGGMGLAIACALRAEGCTVTAIDPKPEPPEFASAQGAPGRYVQGDATDEALVTLHRRQCLRCVRAPRLPCKRRRRRLVRPGRLHRRDGDGDLAPGDGDQPHRVRADGAPCRAVPPAHRRGRGDGPHRERGGPAQHGEHPGERAHRRLSGVEGRPLCPLALALHAARARGHPLEHDLPRRGADSDECASLRGRSQPRRRHDRAYAPWPPRDARGHRPRVLSSCLSDRASFITGIDLVVDGGIMAKL